MPDKHIHDFKPRKMYGITTYQCRCGAYEGKKVRMDKEQAIEILKGMSEMRATTPPLQN